LPDYEYAILDEAHDIERVASDAVGLRVSEGMVLHLLNRLAPSSDKGGKTRVGLIGRYLHLEELCDSALQAAWAAMKNYFLQVQRLFGSRREQQMRLRQAPDLPRELGSALADLAGALGEGARLATDEEAELEISAAAKRASALAESIIVWSAQSDPGHVYWLERAGWGNSERLKLRSAPVHVGQWLEETLFGGTRSVVLTSATLATGRGVSQHGAFAFLRERLGVPAFHAQDQLGESIPDSVLEASASLDLELDERPEPVDPKGEIDPDDARIEMGRAGRYEERDEPRRAKELLLGSPFDYAKQARLVLPDIPVPNAPGYFEALVEETRKACLESAGGVFVLFTSYSQLNQVYSALEAELSFHGFVLLKQGGGQTRTRMLDTFRQAKRCILFGVETFWQGVDVAGDALSTVIISKLPFPVPSDPIVEARSEQIEALGGNAFMDYSVPQAIIRLKQGFGRLIRRKTDSGTVVILDSRIRNKAYGRHFLNALPPAEVLL
ncbi:MAG: hypothetical protein KDB07_11340, partial [Planctomycetes bacterium]|nr:hypothetical protein [Planctomycetota bacterium]